MADRKVSGHVYFDLSARDRDLDRYDDEDLRNRLAAQLLCEEGATPEGWLDVFEQ